MKKLKILFGFDEKKFEDSVISYLNSLGYDVECKIKLSKTSIRDFLIANPDYDSAILLEVLNSSRDDRVAKYTADELAMLTDERNINIVVIINSTHKGTPYMETLYGAGITSAIFQKGRRGGATPKEVAGLILQQRSRREAREYYGLQDATLDIQFLGTDTFNDFVEKLADPQQGTSLIERFVNVCMYMSKKQIWDFIRRLPNEVKDELKLYEEFYIILEILKESGMKTDIKRPRRVSIGLSSTDAMERAKMKISQNSGLLDLRDSMPSSDEVNRRVKDIPFGNNNEKDNISYERTTVSVEESDEETLFADLVNGLFEEDMSDTTYENLESENEESMQHKESNKSFESSINNYSSQVLAEGDIREHSRPDTFTYQMTAEEQELQELRKWKEDMLCKERLREQGRPDQSEEDIVKEFVNSKKRKEKSVINGKRTAFMIIAAVAATLLILLGTMVFVL